MRIIHQTMEEKENFFKNLLKRSPDNYGKYEDTVKAIIADIKERRDEALFEYTAKFDKADINAANIEVTDAEIEEAYKEVSPELLRVIRRAITNIKSYHELQKRNSC